MMTVLDLCGGTGAWSKPYRDAGYAVVIVDPLVDGGDVRLLERSKSPIHGILAAPPCTVFSYARNRYEPTEDEYLKGLSVADACLRIVFANRPRWWALENPRNKIRRWLGPARMTFHHWEFGDAAHKPTCIWGDFRVPQRRPVARTKPSTFRTSKENASPEDAITPAGFAQAFFEANP
jgi:site-specific DNA-cytosine methylase